MAKFQIKVHHVGEENSTGRRWQLATQPAAPVHTEVFDALSREAALIMLQKAYPRYDSHFGYMFEIDKVY